MGHLTTLQQDFSAMVPTVLAAIVVSGLWWAICHYVIYHDQHDAWLAELKRPEDDAGSIDHQIVDSTRRLIAAQRGSPADRLFLGGLAFAGAVGIVVTFLRYVAIG